MKGLRVKLKGLMAKPELNGKEGQLGNFNAETGRWACVLLDGEKVNVKPANFEPLPPPAPAPAPQPNVAATAASPAPAAGLPMPVKRPLESLISSEDAVVRTKRGRGRGGGRGRGAAAAKKEA